MYITGITGNFTCRYGKGTGALVMLTTRPHNIHRKDIISRKFVFYKELFFVAGSIKRIDRPQIFFKIYHTCINSRYQCVVKIVRKIFPSFVYKLGSTVRFLQLGHRELSIIRGSRRRICTRRHTF
uniref:LAGLIDADG_2 domain-containing protein n=1 Tax=Strongyloides venezuelensis TaxID=75913 RepID=A0A0K0F049_STRVS